jgi:chromosome segregation ATPase
MDAGTLDPIDMTDDPFARLADDARPDPRALGRLIGGVREVVEAARTQSLSLQSTIEQASALDGDIAAASRQLHERLSLSARMLKAFQSQIERIEALLGRARADEEKANAINQRMQSRIDEFETRLEKYLERFEARLDDIASRASKRFKDEIAEQEKKLHDAVQAVPAIDSRLRGLEEQLADLETRSASARESLAEALESACEAQCDLRRDAERSMEIAENLSAQSRGLVVDLEASIRAACDAGRDLEARSARAHTLLPSLGSLEQSRARVSELLARLEPILPILKSEESYAASCVSRASELIRAGVQRELRDIAGAFHMLAERPARDALSPSPRVAQPVPVVEIFLPEPAGAD